jgi:putative sigma-54 modulation protein
MIIEFQTPQGEVKKWVLDFVRDKLVELHKRDREIVRAQVYFREMNGKKNEKVCEIDLTIFGDSIFVHRKADSFEKASRMAIDDLTEKIDEQIKKRNEPPDVVTSTVKV